MKYTDRLTRPERVCWGCDRLCPANDLRCGEDKVRAMHPIETLGPMPFDPFRAPESVSHAS